MAKRTTKKEKYKKIANMVRRHGQVTVIFEELVSYPSVLSDEREKLKRRRKLDKRGNSYVSYLGFSTRRWSRYSTSCFICALDTKDLSITMAEMEQHDRGELTPIEIRVGERVIKL